MPKIEIIAISEDKIYSVGLINIVKKGDIYYAYKINNSDLHYSRHRDGRRHWRSKKSEMCFDVGKRLPINEFKGIEFLFSGGTVLEYLPQLHSEYKLGESNGIFAFDTREYKNAAFNMSIAILTEEGIPRLYESWKNKKKRQIYLFTDSTPMIAISICDAKKD